MAAGGEMCCGRVKFADMMTQYIRRAVYAYLVLPINKDLLFNDIIIIEPLQDVSSFGEQSGNLWQISISSAVSRFFWHLWFFRQN